MIALGWFTLAFGLGGALGVVIGSMMRDRAHADHAIERARRLERAHRKWHADRGVGWSETSADCYLCKLDSLGRTIGGRNG